jgi:hypothetical protein
MKAKATVLASTFCLGTAIVVCSSAKSQSDTNLTPEEAQVVHCHDDCTDDRATCISRENDHYQSRLNFYSFPGEIDNKWNNEFFEERQKVRRDHQESLDVCYQTFNKCTSSCR